jgi:hypothetical protein
MTLSIINPSDKARVGLAVVRLLNGVLALVAPKVLIARISPGGPPDPAAVYAFRLFGIRTILIGGDLLRTSGAERDKAVAEAPIIHGSDTATATLLTVTKAVSPRTGVPLILISGLNTVLSVIAARGLRR